MTGLAQGSGQAGCRASPWFSRVGDLRGLVRQLWSFAGDDSRKDVNQLLFEPFVNYNFDNGWYLVSDMVITYDWKAPSGDALTIPVGGGFGKLFKVGDQAMNARAEAYYNVERPRECARMDYWIHRSVAVPKVM